MRKSTRYSLLIVLALVAALAFAIFLRKTAPPEAARLLPESDAIVYVNLKPLRLATHFDRTPSHTAPIISTSSTPPASCPNATSTPSPLPSTAWTTPMARTVL